MFALPVRVGWLILAALLSVTIALSCGGSEEETEGTVQCASDAECPAGFRCIASKCVGAAHDGGGGDEDEGGEDEGGEKDDGGGLPEGTDGGEGAEGQVGDGGPEGVEGTPEGIEGTEGGANPDGGEGIEGGEGTEGVEGGTGKCGTFVDCTNHPAGPICDGLSGQCRPCAQNAECNPIVGPDAECSAGKCIVGEPPDPNKCKSAADCASDPVGPVCDLSSGVCRKCVINADCIDVTGPGTSCQAGTCVNTPPSTCASNQDCTDPNAPVCGQLKHTCNPCDNLIYKCSGGKTCTNGQCIGAPGTCSFDQECTAPAKHCNVAANKCVECLSNGDCTNGTCDTVAGKCVPFECEVDADCATNAKGKVCDVGVRQCVQCLQNADCKDPSADKCDFAERKCVGCSTDSDCKGNPAGEACDAARKKCVGCTTIADCSGFGASYRCTPWQSCEDYGCSSNGQCFPGYSCQASVCAPDPISCGANADCETWLRCLEPGKTCGPVPNYFTCDPLPWDPEKAGFEGRTCASDGDCQAGLKCQMDGGKKRCRQTCSVDSDCCLGKSVCTQGQGTKFCAK